MIAMLLYTNYLPALMPMLHDYCAIPVKCSPEHLIGVDVSMLRRYFDGRDDDEHRCGDADAEAAS